MNKVIDAGALIDALEHEDGRTLGLKKVKEVIDNQPSAIKDTPEAYWERVPSTVYRCTACNAIIAQYVERR